LVESLRLLQVNKPILVLGRTHGLLLPTSLKLALLLSAVAVAEAMKTPDKVEAVAV
jgi:hypothetical protein